MAKRAKPTKQPPKVPIPETAKISKTGDSHQSSGIKIDVIDEDKYAEYWKQAQITPQADPHSLSKEEREYYRSAWGFDPVGAAQPLVEGKFRYNACVPLEDIGVIICARVIWHEKGHCSYIIFQRDTEETYVASTNRLIYAGLTPITPGFDFNIRTPREKLTPEARELLRRAGNPAVLPPWVHFAALKTYITAVAELGLLSLFRQSYPDPKESEYATSHSTFAEWHQSFAWGLHAIAPSIAEAVFRDLATEFFGKHPMDLHTWLSLMNTGFSPFEAEEYFETDDLEEKMFRENNNRIAQEVKNLVSP